MTTETIGRTLVYAAVFLSGMVAMVMILSLQSRYGGWAGSDGGVYKIVRIDR